MSAPSSSTCPKCSGAMQVGYLLERGHGARFKALMDGFLPDWRERRKLLNAAVNGA